MFYQFLKSTAFLLPLLLFSYSGHAEGQRTENPKDTSTLTRINSDSIVVGANQTEKYIPLLEGKKVGFIGNQTSVIFRKGGYTHLVDSLLSRGIQIKRVFSPEHGFRGTASAGEAVEDGIDEKTGIPILSLYGDHQKPTPEDLKDLDILLFDIQDVGLRFYTYLSTLHYIMEAAAENDLPLLLLDRPNPNGNYIDGPILQKEFKSFVGMDPVPVVHGMTIAEYAQMVNGQGWLKKGVQCELEIVTVENYKKDQHYSLPIKPSPNLPNNQSINLYPSLCFFEGTNVNAGRGTDFQFQVFGSPELDPDYFDFEYTPQPNAGTKHPKHEGELCYGRDLRETAPLQQINLEWVIEAYEHTAHPDQFFNDFFNKLAGNAQLRQQIENGMNTAEIRATWTAGLEQYDEMRQAYLLYE